MTDSTRESARRRGDRRGLALLACLGVFMAGWLGLAQFVRQSRPTLESGTLCPSPELVPEHVVVLVDQTDSLTQVQVEHVQSRIEGIRDEADHYTRISVSLVGEEVPRPPRFVFSLCKPLQGQEVNRLVRDSTLTQERFEEDFDEPLRCAIQSIARLREAPASPLIEHLDAVLGWSEFRNASRKRIVFISDYLQNTQALSHYDVSPAPLNSLGLLGLTGVDLQMVYLLREGREDLQTEQHRVAWREYLLASGAQLVPTPDSIVGWSTGLGPGAQPAEEADCDLG